MELASLHQQVEAEKFCHYLLADDHDAWQIAQDYCDFLRETPGLADADTPRVLLLGYEIGSAVSHLRDTVIEEIAQPLEQQGVPADKMERLCLEILEQLGLRELAFAHPAQLSGGQTRRMQVASFLAAAPEVIVACEPGAGLDPDSAQAVVRTLRGYASSGAGVVLCLDYDTATSQNSSEPAATTSETAASEPVKASGPNPSLPRIQPGTTLAEWSGIRAHRGAPKRRWWQLQKSTTAAREFSSNPVDLQARSGAVCWLRGTNGAGKTTLLRQLAGINADNSAAEDIAVSLALQDPAAQVLDSSASEMLADEKLWEIITGTQNRERDTSELTRDTHPLDLSPSQLRLLQVASVVAQRRQVVLLDEPDVGLTPADHRSMHELIHECLAGGAAVIMTCHDPTFIQSVISYAQVTEVQIVPGVLPPFSHS